MSNNHITPWCSVSIANINEDLFKALRAYTPPRKVEVGIDYDGFATGWNAAIRYMREHPDPVKLEDILPNIRQVIFNGPATIVCWDDGSKTVVKCQPGDTFSTETGLMAAMLKRFMGNDNTYNKVLNHWLEAAAPQLPDSAE